MVVAGRVQGATPEVDGPAHPSALVRGSGLVVWTIALIAGTALFHAAGDGPLAPPPIDPAAWLGWAEGRDPLIATVAVLRLVGLALSWYLVGATAIGIVARTLRAARLIRIADALTVPALRRFLQATLGVSLATAMVAAALPPSAPPAATTASATSLRAPSDPPDHAASGTDPAPPSAAAAPGVEAIPGAVAPPGVETIPEVMPGVAATPGDVGGRRPLPLEISDRAVGAAPADEVPTQTPGELAAGGQKTEPREEHVVAVGDSFWTIARDTVASELGRAPDDAEIHGYWVVLVDLNRDRLADRENPDLIFPGQRLLVPPPARPGP